MDDISDEFILARRLMANLRSVESIEFIDQSLLTPAVLLHMVRINPSFAIPAIPEHLLTQELCDISTEVDETLIRFVPNRFMSEPILFRAISKDPGLSFFCKNKQLFSERVKHQIIRTQKNGIGALPQDIVDSNLIQEFFKVYCELPAVTNESLPAAIRATKKIVSKYKRDHRDNYRNSANNLKQIVERFASKNKSSEDLTDEDLIEIVCNDKGETSDRVCAFLALGLDSPVTASKNMSSRLITKILSDFHGDDILSSHAPRHSRRNLLSNSFDL